MTTRAFRVAPVAAFLALLAAAPATRPVNPYPADWFFGRPEQRQQHDAMIGQPMPLLKLSDWMNGEVKPEDMKGKIVVVDFWATWCPPCLAAIPHNNELASKYGPKGVVLIGVCGSANGQDKMAAVVQARKIAYPVAKDATQESARAWRVMWWPTYAVVDRAGKVRAVGLKPNAVEQVVEKLLAETPAN